MRYRRVKGATEKLEKLSGYITTNPQDFKGRWKEVFGNDNDIYLEMGCGKGQFITQMAKKHPERNFIGVEGQERVLLRAAQLASTEGITNVTFVCEFLREPSLAFDKGEVAGLFLNFSDPWPKARHAKRRLTHRRYLGEYRKILVDSGNLQFKTDNDDLFDFSVEEFTETGMKIVELTYDLHNTLFNSREVTTEYEDKFRSWGKTIKYAKVEY